jgi:hypothetical protein
MPMLIERPAATEHSPYYASYIARVVEADVLDVLARQPEEMQKALGGLSRERATYRYAPDKWSVAEVVGHMADAERIFAYRALCIARGDRTPLPGYDEDLYVPESHCDQRGLPRVLEDFNAVRRATLTLLEGLQPGDFARTGTANGTPISARAITYILGGHVRHHMNTLRERYGVG